MRERVVAARYARALLEIALEKGALMSVQEGLAGFAAACDQVPLLLSRAGNDELSLATRLTMIEKVCEKLGCDELVTDVIKVMLRNGRVALARYISDKFNELVAASQGLADVKVTVADEAVAGGVCDRVRAILEEKLGRPARCEVHADHNIIGGLTVNIGDTIFDISVRGRLDQFKDMLLQ